LRAFIALVVRRRVTVIMAALAVSVFGIVGYSRLSLELFPDISYPSLTVQTEFPDTAPQEVEYLVTRPVEEAVGVLPGLTTIHSISRAGVSEVTLEFDWDSDMDLLSMEVRDKLDRLTLPEDTEDPIVLRFDPALDPILRLALAGDGELTQLRYYAEQKLKVEFETIPGIAAAQVKGGLEAEIQIEVDQERMAAFEISMDRIRQLVGASNLNLPGGALRGENNQYLVRTVNEFTDVEEIGDLVLRQDESALVRLRDVAVVRAGSKEREEITRVNGRESVEIAIYKEADANTVLVAKDLGLRLAQIQSKLRPGDSLSILFDQSKFIAAAVSEVRNAALLGGLLAMIVLFLFLRDLRSTIIIFISIPLSVVATFLCMYRLDVSLNIMSLGGLTLGIGMLVDNSIVVLESIFRRREAGASAVDAAIDGCNEVGPAVIASTLTTVAVFLPIVFVEGVAGQLFVDQAVTVTLSLLASLVVALTVIPMLAAWGGRSPAAARATEALPHGTLNVLYDGLLAAGLKRRWLTLSMSALFFAASVWAVPRLGSELIPPLSEGEFFFEVNLPEGSSLVATDRIMQEMEEAAVAQEGVERHYSTVGSRLVAGGMSLQTKAENLGQLNIVLEDGSDEKREQEVASVLRARFAGIPDLDVKFGRPSYFSLSTPVEIVLFGDELEELRAASLDVVRELSSVEGLTDLRSSLEAGNPELQVVFDRERLAGLGLDMSVLSETLRQRVLGSVPTRFKEADRQIDIRIRNQESDRADLEDVRQLFVPGPGGQSLRLLSVADVKLDRGPAEIHRLQQQRAAIISANVRGRSLGAATTDVKAKMSQFSLPAGMTTEMGGQDREMRSSFASLRFAIGLAIFLVYLVMASTFESFLHPFVILFTIPLALVGVVAALLVTKTSISVIVMIGVVMLVGIVVNNAIVLIDSVKRLREQGLEREAAVRQAGHLRLRPILMTTATTVLGLLPMAMSFGEGAELRAPLAITVAGGLLLSTLLTLVVIPAVYLSIPASWERRPTP
jgi:HAE1 family hydrophobic/amphiphilic exporter-1